jgi:formiminotetrahydrofolate cyclodeaminase
MTVWTETLEAFRQKLASREPVPAGVTAAAVTASMALGLLIKVLDITRNRKSFAGDAEEFHRLIHAARNEAQRLAQCADDDIAAFRAYVADHSITRPAIEVPLVAAEAAAAGLKLCGEAKPLINETLAPDLETAIALLEAAIEGILGSIDSNLRRETDAQYRSMIEARVGSIRGC